jgi:hypothetical protein
MELQLAIFLGLCLGGLLGIIGQSIRAIIGIKKVMERGLVFQWSILYVSLFIGFVAGTLAWLGLFFSTGEIPNESLLTVLAAGYAGTDFIEGFMQRNK